MRVFINSPLSHCLVLGLMISTAQAQEARFPGFAPDHAPPADYDGMVFELSQDYPAEEPASETMPWDSISFVTEPLDYARAVLAYGVEGNLEVDWVIQNNEVRKWYHAPWMHPGCGGREYIRGMTRERTSRPGELHPDQTEWCDNWAVGFYNPPGGYTLGKVWADENDPDPSHASFPHGTVGMKLLFTTATVEEVPFLEGSLEWTGNIYPRTGSNPCGPNGPPRENLTLRLLQIDIAVRDSRKDASTGWVFGTFIYDGSAEGETAFDRMQPVGLSWADDAEVTTDMNRPGAFINPDLEDGVLNEDLIGPWDPANPAKARILHAGLGGRLNGPVDNPISSCISCHGRAGAPSQRVVPSGISRAEDYTEEAFEQFFAEIPHGAGTSTAPDGTEYTRLDYSLQLAVGIRNFRNSVSDLEAVGDTDPVGPEINRDGLEEAQRWTTPDETENAKSDGAKSGDVKSDEVPSETNYVLYIVIAAIVLIMLLYLVMKK